MLIIYVMHSCHIKHCNFVNGKGVLGGGKGVRGGKVTGWDMNFSWNTEGYQKLNVMR